MQHIVSGVQNCVLFLLCVWMWNVTNTGVFYQGNIVLTDHEYTILNILRQRTDESQDVRFAVREKYPVDAARPPDGVISTERYHQISFNKQPIDLIEHWIFYAVYTRYCTYYCECMLFLIHVNTCFCLYNRLMEILLTGKDGDSLKKLLIPHLVYGPAVIEHCMLTAGLQANAKLHKDFHPTERMFAAWQRELFFFTYDL